MLTAWNYLATIWNSQDLVSAGNLCEWNTAAWPLQQMIRQLERCPLGLPDKARLALEILILLRGSHCSPFKQTPVIQAVLNAVSNPVAVSWMLQRLPISFPFDFQSEDFLRSELLYWLRLR